VDDDAHAMHMINATITLGCYRALPSARDSPSAVEREQATRKDEAELMVVAERKKKAGAGRERSSEPSATMACGGAAAAARQRAEGESASGGAQMAAGAAADAAGGSWWPTRACPRCRMLATRRPGSAGSPRRHGATVPARGRDVGAGAGAGKGVSAGGLGRLRPVGQKRGRGLLAPPFSFSIFFEFLFSNSF